MGAGNFRFVLGTGKWEGNQGSGRTLGMLRRRADGCSMPRWEMVWKVDSGSPGDSMLSISYYTLIGYEV